MTAIAVWPTSLPRAGSAGVSGGPQSNVISFQPERGPTIDRRAASSVNRIRDCKLPMLTQTQYLTFLDFFDNTLKSGILPFTWVDPITSATAKVKFVQKEQRAFNEERITKDYIAITFQLMILRYA